MSAFKIDINKENEKLSSLLKKIFGSKIKIKTIKINISNSFAIRTACKFCQSGPSVYIEEAVIIAQKEVRSYLSISKDSRKAVKNFNFKEQSFLIRAFKVEDKSYNPKFHSKHRSCSLNSPNGSFICRCGATIWSVNSSMETKLEVKHRKGKYSYPKKFTFF